MVESRKLDPNLVPQMALVVKWTLTKSAPGFTSLVRLSVEAIPPKLAPRRPRWRDGSTQVVKNTVEFGENGLLLKLGATPIEA
jgi:hypothetical protein